jgi:hypothetical protein
MAKATIATKVHQTLHVHRNFATKVAFDNIFTVNGFADLEDFGVRQLVHTTLSRDSHLFTDLLGFGSANAMNVLQRDQYALVRRYVDASYPGHFVSPFTAPPPCGGSAPCGQSIVLRPVF